ncbi:MAG TPA: N-acetylmuramoyl-L-alanine amidase [Sandaracinaceae bacterium LLY-WYZ-13_1]|nr:N-acetylmuramoyl-L-alanine amidase [Sandaracinaceae bacterium LLY-WYZ-13_1]
MANTTQRTIRSGWTASLVLLLAGCTAQLGTGEEGLAHGRQEMRVTVAQLQEGWRADGDWLVSPPLMAPEGASRVGVLLGLDAAGDLPALEARQLRGGAPVGDWVPVEATWSEEDHHVGVAELGAVVDGAQLRIAAEAVDRVRQLRWNAVVPDEGIPMAPAGDGDLGARREALRSELSGLGIVTREAWGARATRCTSRNATKTRMAVHYTVTPSANPERQVRGIQRYHMDSRGWCDVGYHFLVGIDGTVYEGRPLHLLGAHVGGHNTNNIGVSFVGCFHPTCDASWGPRRPPEAMIEAGGRLLGALGDLYGIALDGSHVRGHRDHSGASTSCPGDYLHARIDDMLSIARAGGGSSPTPPPPSGDASCTHSYGGTYAHRACSSGWQCCDGSWSSRGACGGCLCVEESGTTGCTTASDPEPTPEPPSEPPPGDSCTHSYGGRYANTACSSGWQCCDGSWGSRGSCGACFCVEESGTTGCGAEPPEPAGPPAGAGCSHTYGGRYANTACSSGWQCCDGSWRSRGSCGDCYCVEESGTTGCGT